MSGAGRAGTPVVTYQWSAYSSGLSWFDPPESLEIWSKIFPDFFAGPVPNPTTNTQWKAHLWEADDGRRLIRFDGRH